MSLYGTGGYAQIKIDIGSQAPVNGFQSSGNKSIYGGNLSSSLPTEYNIQTGDGIAQLQQTPSSTVVWVNVAGTWKQGTLWIKVSGDWKVSTPFVKVAGTWK